MDIIDRRKINDVETLSIGYFDIYGSVDDSIELKELFSSLFSIGEELYFFFHMQEDLTSSDDLRVLKERITQQIEANGEMRYLSKLDDRRFQAIVAIKLPYDFPNLFVDLFKYYYSCDFFVPINDLTFDEYEDYLEVRGVNDVDGIFIIQNKLTNLICIKGLDADHINISYDTNSVDTPFRKGK